MIDKDKAKSYFSGSLQKGGIYYLNKDIPIWIEEPLPEKIDLSIILRKIENIIPLYYFKDIYSIRIGTFEELLKRQLNALYHEGTIYVSNIQDDNFDMMDDIVHELGHSVEQSHYQEIYGDGTIEEEFLGKRNRLADLLKSYGFKIDKKQFLNPEYDLAFDMMLFKSIGYPKLFSFCEGLFMSPYSVTSINEYFTIGFEDFYLRNTNYLKKICPILTEKINILDDLANGYI